MCAKGTVGQMTKIKICGLSRECDIEYANTLMPEFIGFVFFSQSKRYVNAEKAQELKNALDMRIKSVGVFVNESPELICRLYDNGVIDYAQLHGTENNNYIEVLRSCCRIPIIKAFSVSGERDAAEAERSCADYILLDNGNGGTGKSFDWSFLSKIKRPYFLAGGLNSINIKDAVRSFRPYAVDVSSGAETNGFKDFSKMKFLIEAVRENIIE